MLERLSTWIEHGPKNRAAYYLFYIPVMLALGLLALFLLMGVLPEAIAWLFGLACVATIIFWPIIKIIEWISGRKIL